MVSTATWVSSWIELSVADISPMTLKALVDDATSAIAVWKVFILTITEEYIAMIEINRDNIRENALTVKRNTYFRKKGGVLAQAKAWLELKTQKERPINLLD